jgi:hypothetical protein
MKYIPGERLLIGIELFEGIKRLSSSPTTSRILKYSKLLREYFESKCNILFAGFGKKEILLFFGISGIPAVQITNIESCKVSK